jgi:hypothetical protein
VGVGVEKDDKTRKQKWQKKSTGKVESKQSKAVPTVFLYSMCLIKVKSHW